MFVRTAMITHVICIISWYDWCYVTLMSVNNRQRTTAPEIKTSILFLKNKRRWSWLIIQQNKPRCTYSLYRDIKNVQYLKNVQKHKHKIKSYVQNVPIYRCTKGIKYRYRAQFSWNVSWKHQIPVWFIFECDWPPLSGRFIALYQWLKWFLSALNFRDVHRLQTAGRPWEFM